MVTQEVRSLGSNTDKKCFDHKEMMETDELRLTDEKLYKIQLHLGRK